MVENIYENEDVLELEEQDEIGSNEAGFMLGFNDAIPVEI